MNSNSDVKSPWAVSDLEEFRYYNEIHLSIVLSLHIFEIEFFKLKTSYLT